MPIYQSGICNFCLNQSDKLVSRIGFDRQTGRIMLGLACPSCCVALEKIQEVKHEHRNN